MLWTSKVPFESHAIGTGVTPSALETPIHALTPFSSVGAVKRVLAVPLVPSIIAKELFAGFT